MPVTLVKSGWISGNLVFEQKNPSGQIHFGVDGTGLDVKFFGATASAYALWDESADKLLFAGGAGQRFNDSAPLTFGDADDVSVKWDGSNLLVLPVADDTGIFKIGNGTLDMDVRVTLGAAGDYVEFDVGNKALEVVGDARIDLSSATIASGNTDGGVIKGGTSVAPITEDTANMKFISLYFDDGALSGEAVGIYDRLYVTGPGGEGIALRAFCSVTDVAAGNARGAHISLSFGASGSVTGLGTALETTLHIPSGGGLAGTVSSIKAAINSDGAGSDPAGSRLSVFNVVSQGDGTGMADVDTDCALFDFQGFAIGDGKMIAVKASGAAPAVTESVRVRMPDGTPRYIMLSPDPLTA